MLTFLIALLGWVLLGSGACLIGWAMASDTSTVKIAGLKINAAFWGFFNFMTGLVLVAFITS